MPAALVFWYILKAKGICSSLSRGSKPTCIEIVRLLHEEYYYGMFSPCAAFQQEPWPCTILWKTLEILNG
jgi:hypothetical protein